MMTRLVSWAFFVAIGIVALLLVLPGFIDWSRHKDLLINEISARLGQEVRIAGDVSLSILPNPHVRMEQVTIGPEGKDRYLVSLDKLDARMSFSQLLHGRFEVDEITLREPVINIIDGTAGSNWTVFLQDLRRDAGTEDVTKTSMIVLRQVQVNRARIIYRTAEGAPKWEMSGVNMSMGAGSLAGPYQMRGDLMYGEEPVNFSLMTLPTSDDGGIPFELHLDPVDNLAVVDVNGKLSLSGSDAVTAAVSTKEGGLRSLLSPFASHHAALAGIPAIDDPTTTATFDLAVSATRVAARNIKASMGKDATLAGDVIFQTGKTDIDADITLTAPTYWLSFDGNADVAQKHIRGDIMLKAESLKNWAPGMPDVSAEVSGALSRLSDTDWTVSNMTLSFVEWMDAEFKGRAQRKSATTTFTLQDGKIGAATDIGLNGTAAAAGLSATGTANLFGKSLAFTMSGSADKPELSVDMKAFSPQMIVSEMGVAADAARLEGGTVAFTGGLDMSASEVKDIVNGRLQVTPAQIVVKKFDPETMAEKALEHVTVPKNLGQTMLEHLQGNDGRFSARPLDFSLPLKSKNWQMSDLSYDGGAFDLSRERDGAVKVMVKAGADGMPAYSGTLPLGIKNLPVDEVADIIRARNPEPKANTQQAIGGILDRLENMNETATDAAGSGETADHVDIFKTAPPATDIPMPPQPQPALPEVEVGAPPTLPDDVPLAVEPVENGGVGDPLPEDIFPIESEEALPPQ